MIHQLPNGTYRVRYAYGHEQRYTKLKKIKNPSQKVLDEIKTLEDEWGLPKRINVRRSLNCVHRWQAEEVEELFKSAHALEVQGKKVPQKFLNIDVAPERHHYIDELGYLMASICGFRVEVIDNLDYDVFLAQSDANDKWIENLEITRQEVISFALSHCDKSSDFSLKNKTVLFTGAVCGFTGDEEYLRCLRKMAKEVKADVIITAGPWVKSIFLHKTSKKPKVLKFLKELTKEIKVLAIRSNRDKPEHLHAIKDYGVEFINGIEDEKNVFTGLSTTSSSTKNQLKKFEEAYPGKNVYFYTSFVGIKSQATEGGGLRYLTGSGSSGYNTPRARVWANAYDNQLLNSGIRDSIGGHLLRFDGEGNVFPTTFRYHSDLKAILFGGKAFFRNKWKAGRLHIILSDFHACSHHKESFTAFLTFLKENKDKIETLVINGDFLDNMVLCHHNQGKMLDQIQLIRQDMDFLKEIAYTKECLKKIVEPLNPDTKKVFKLGNHEVNSFKKFLQRDINHFLESLLNIERLLGLKDFNFAVIPSREAYKIAGIILHHGHEMHRVQAKKTFGKNTARGHSHLLLIDADGMTISGMEDKNKAHYLFHPYVDWTTGFATITEVDEHSVMPQPMVITNNKYADFDRIREIKNPIEVPLPKKLTLEYDIEWTGREEL